MKKLLCCIFGHKFMHGRPPRKEEDEVLNSLHVGNARIQTHQVYPLMVHDDWNGTDAVLKWCTRCNEGVFDISQSNPKLREALKSLMPLDEDPEDMLKRYVKVRNTFTMLWLKIAGATKFERRLIYKLLKKEFNEQK